MTHHRVGWNTVWDESHLTPDLLPWLCRWSSAERTARSTSSEDGSPTVRDLARSLVNTGSVSGSGVWVSVFVCVLWQGMTHARVFFTLYCQVGSTRYMATLWCRDFVKLSPYQQHNESQCDMKLQVKHSYPKQKEEGNSLTVGKIAGHDERWIKDKEAPKKRPTGRD